MNLVAVAAFVIKVAILDFILMSNHVHFVVQASLEETRRFINYFKMLYGKYSGKRHGEPGLLRRNSVDFRKLEDNEAVCNAIAYVQMNCVAANICIYPYQYPWGCGSTFFNPSGAEGVPIGNLTGREQSRITHSRVKLPENYKVIPDGVISPASFVRVKLVESIFRTPNRFQYFLSKSSKARKRLENDAMPSFRDQVILEGIADLCHSMFRKASVQELAQEEKSELLKQLRYRFSADLAQLSRVSGIPYHEASRLLDTC